MKLQCCDGLDLYQGPVVGSSVKMWQVPQNEKFLRYPKNHETAYEEQKRLQYNLSLK